MENIIREAIKNHGLDKLGNSYFKVYTNLDGILKDYKGKIIPTKEENQIREWHGISKNQPIYAIFYNATVEKLMKHHISSCILENGISFRTIIDSAGQDKETAGFIKFSAIEEVTYEKIDFDDKIVNSNSRYIPNDLVTWGSHRMNFHILSKNIYLSVSRLYFCDYDISEALNDLLKKGNKYYKNLDLEYDRLVGVEKYVEKYDDKYEELIELAEKNYNNGVIPFQEYYFHIIDALLKLKRYDEAEKHFFSFQEKFHQYNVEGRDFVNIAEYYILTRTLLAITNEDYNDVYQTASHYQYLSENSSKDFSKEKNDNYNTYIANFNKIDYNERRIITTSKTTQLFRSDHITLLDMDNLPDIKFPITHPKQDHTYICHPYKTDIYLPIEDYDKELLSDHINEFCYLLQCLGATSISVENVKGESNDRSSHKNIQIDAGAKYKKNSAGINIEYDSRDRNFSKNTLKIGRNQHFNPTKKPFVPEDLVWFPHQAAWQRLVQQRMDGNLLSHSEYMSSSEQKIVSESEMININAELKILFASIKANAKANHEHNIENNNDMEWRVSVTFKPMEEFNDDSYEYTEALPVNEPLQIEESITNDKEQQYMEEIRFMLDDNGMIDQQERMMLDSIANTLEIPSERAQQLEMLVLSENELTKEEKEYLEKYKVFIENGEVSERERQMLIRFANLLGISEERALELEKQA